MQEQMNREVSVQSGQDGHPPANDVPTISAADSIRMLKISRWFDLAKDVVKYGTWLGLAYFGVQAIGTLAGKDTEAVFMLSYLTSSESDYGLPWLVAFAGVVFGYVQRRLRLRKTEYFQGRVRELEMRLDPGRSSSGLLANGETAPEDRML